MYLSVSRDRKTIHRGPISLNYHFPRAPRGYLFLFRRKLRREYHFFYYGHQTKRIACDGYGIIYNARFVSARMAKNCIRGVIKGKRRVQSR